MSLVKTDDGVAVVSQIVRDGDETRVQFTEIRPRGLVSDELLRMAHLGHLPRISLDWPEDGDPVVTFTDDYGNRFLYVVRDYDPARRRCAFWMEWPD